MNAPAAVGTRYSCPLECGWHCDLYEQGMAPLSWVFSRPGGGVEKARAAGAGVIVDIVTDQWDAEVVVHRHLESHTLLEWVQTVTDLRHEVRLAQAMVSGVRGSAA